jgi:trigger factor
MKGLKQSGLSIAAVNSQNLELGSNDDHVLISAEVELVPTIELGIYKGIPIKYESLEASNEEVEATLQRARESHAVLESTEEAVQENNIATIEYIGKIDGKEFEGGSSKTPFDLQIGSKKFIAGFEEQLIGAKKGEKKIVPITFPETYYKVELRNKEAVFDVEIKVVKNKKLPELNDEFARSVGYTNLLDARDCLKKDLTSQKVRQNESLIEHQIMNALSDSCTVSPIPQKVLQEQVEAELHRVVQGTKLTEEKYFERTRTNKEEFVRRYKPMVEREIKVRYILDKIAETEGICLSVNELEAAVAEEAKQKKCSVNQINKDLIQRNRTVLKTLAFLKMNAIIEKAVVREI